jgi:hypothetical protein
MSFLRGLFGLKASPQPTRIRVEVSSFQRYDNGEQLAVVAVGSVAVPAVIYRDYQRDTQDWSSGVRLEDPTTGRRMTDDDNYPPDFYAAGARSIAVAGIEHHPGAQSDAFGICKIVRLVPEPTNPVDPNAIAVCSNDRSTVAGYVPADELAKVREASPLPGVGLIVWENFTWRPRRRIGIRVVMGPSVALRLVPPAQVPSERARREATYAAGREAGWAKLQAQREAKEAAKLALKAEREAQAAARTQKAEQASAWRAAGLCVDCGGVIPTGGRRAIRCPACRAG